jgi:hypothetical protein
MNGKAYDRLNKQIEGYKENSQKDREKFWKKYLTTGTDDERACSQCDCKSLRMDNLRYLEKLYEENKR